VAAILTGAAAGANAAAASRQGYYSRTSNGGQLHLEPLASDSSGAKSYRISLMVGSDRHDIDIMQAASR